MIQSFVNDAIQGDLQYYANTTLNASFSDNTGNVPDNWDNYAEGDNITNAWNASGYVTTTLDAATSVIENGIWYQSLSVSNLHDGVASATVSYQHRLIDNDNAASVVLRVLLDNTTDNTTLLNENVTANESASWTSGENSVLDNITATGTYTLYLVAELASDNTNIPNVQVGWNVASLTITTQGYEPMTGASAVMLSVVPLFYVIGLLLTAITWMTKVLKK